MNQLPTTELNFPSRRTFLGGALTAAAALALTRSHLAAQERQFSKILVEANPESNPFATDWQLQSAAVATDTGEKSSSPDFAAAGWYNTTLPTTVLAALVASGEYP